MKKIILFFFLLATVILLANGCYQKTAKEAVPIDAPAVINTDAGMVLSVTADVENVRRRPNGRILGQLRKGDQVTVIRHIGNWVQFANRRYQDAWVWGPSVGFDYINLYSPDTYYDRKNRKFYDIEYFQRLFSQVGQERQSYTSSYELFFGNLGLGSHEETIMNVAEATEIDISHGVTLFVDRPSKRVTKVKVHYFRPLQGIDTALKKSELPAAPPSIRNNGHVIWKSDVLVPGLVVDLERREWDSDWFSVIWFMLPEQQ